VYINKERLDVAISVLYEEQIDSYYSGYFTFLLQNDNVRSTSFWEHTGASTTINIGQLDKRLRIVHMDLLNLATVSIRLILQQNLRGDKCEYRIGDELWRFFASADIDLFFVVRHDDGGWGFSTYISYPNSDAVQLRLCRMNGRNDVLKGQST
jgi:hypothetical protein